MDSLKFYFHGDPKYPALLFLHGFMGCAQDWEPIIAELKSDYYCIAVDLPGHGASTCDFVSLDGFIQKLSGICEDFISLNIIGYSMGGRIGLELMLRYPRLFKRGLIISAHPGLSDQSEREQRYQADLALLAGIETESDLRAFLERWYQQPLFAQLNQHPDFEKLLSLRMRNRPAHLRQALRLFSVGSMPSVWHQLKTVPIHYLYGELDYKYRQLALEGIAPLGIPVTAVPQAGHQLLLEAPREISSQVRKLFIL